MKLKEIQRMRKKYLYMEASGAPRGTTILCGLTSCVLSAFTTVLLTVLLISGLSATFARPVKSKSIDGGAMK